jgi:hypothetical protein
VAKENGPRGSTFGSFLKVDKRLRDWFAPDRSESTRVFVELFEPVCGERVLGTVCEPRA